MWPANLRSVIDRLTFRVTQSELEREFRRFHATAAQQTADRKRDQEHLHAGRAPLRITHAQVFFEAAGTTALLADVFTACQCRLASRSTKLAA
jgi:hypothetical protein